MIKLVAFDWNGTLFADTYAVFLGDNKVLTELGEKAVSFADFQKYFDVPVKNYYKALGISEKKVEEKSAFISEVFHAFYEPRAIKIRTRSHTKTLLKDLQKQKIPAIIISNHIKDKIEIHTKRLEIHDYFENILGNTSITSAMQSRSKMQRLINYLNKKHIEHKDVLIVGDTLEEVEIAKEIGALSAAITQGNCSTARLKAAKPDYLISDLGNLINIINEINTA